MTLKDCDISTAQYVRHVLAGRLANLNFAAKALKEGKINFSDKTPIIDVILRDSEYIRGFVASFPESIEKSLTDEV